jgi:preprotein translocase subunit SecD
LALIQAPRNSAAFQKRIASLDCTDPNNYSGRRPDESQQWLGTCERSGIAKYNLEPTFINGWNITRAEAVLPQNGVGWVVAVEFDFEGATSLSEVSTQLAALPECGAEGANPCNAFAIVLDGVVVSAPRFNEPIVGGTAQIEGDYTSDEANQLADILKYGPLPVTLEPIELTTVPTGSASPTGS